MVTTLEAFARTPVPIKSVHFNQSAILPYGVTVAHIERAMNEFIDFLGFLNQQLATRKIPRLESMIMPANFSSMVGEFVVSAIPKYCKTVVKNTYHNGHPDLLPANKFPEDACQYGHDGIEIKGSRYLQGWQGHNAEASFLMVFCYEASRPNDISKHREPIPFRYLMVCGAQLDEDDWIFSGRTAESRRTITASVLETGYTKMMANWIYRSPDL